MIRKITFLISLVVSAIFPTAATVAHSAQVRIGTKAFTEGYLLGELAAQKIESIAGKTVARKFGLGSTGIVVQALETGQIDLYPEYTGTISEAVLHNPSIRDWEQIQKLLHKKGLVMSRELGFENTYALAVRSDFAKANHLTDISDLKGIESRIRAAFSHEFMSRDDGLKSLERIYGLAFDKGLQSVDHMLSYQFVAQNKADLIEVYSTDDRIDSLDLILLKDDRGIFPPYRAVFLAKEDFVKQEHQIWEALNSLGGTLTESAMRGLNGEVERKHRDPPTVIKHYLKNASVPSTAPASPPSIWPEIENRTREHLLLVGIALFISTLTGVPLGILAFRYRRLGRACLIAISVIQTVPSLALLALLIPAFGIGLTPALVALFLYSLLPVVQNTLIGLQSIDPRLLETARSIGLSRSQIMTSIELPMASRNIIGGIRTAAIIGIGTATLAALIGAGGYGAPIISGLATNNTSLILTGAIPCALMALLTFVIFELADRICVPKGLQRGAE